MVAAQNVCDCIEETSADFLMEETVGPIGVSWTKYTNTDSIFAGKTVRFSALSDDADYTWYIGSEVLHTKTVGRSFPDNLLGQTLPITLVVKKNPNSMCFPNDDGYDSIVKYLTVAQLNLYNFLDTTFLEGTYRVAPINSMDSFDMIIDYRNYGSVGQNRKIDIYNYDGQGSNCTNRIHREEINFRQFWTSQSTSVTQCDYLEGTFHLRLDGVFETDYTTGGYENGVYNTTLNKHKYIGRKL